MNNIEEIIGRLKTRAAIAELIGPDEMIVSASDLNTLIALLEAAQKEITDWRSVAEAAAQDDADWHKLADKDGELICKMANAIIAVGERAKKAELELIKPLPIGELIHRLEGQTYRKWYDGDDLDKMRVRAEAAEKERDELQAEQEEHDGQIREMEGKIQLRNAAIRSRTARCERAKAALKTAEARLLVPDGMKLVPVEPTEKMVIDGFESEPDESFSDESVWEEYEAMSGCAQAAHRAKLCWAAMLAAAPNNPVEGGE